MDDDARNYFQSIERHFVERRGRALLLSPEDVQRVTAWHRLGIPLEAVIEGIDIHFDRILRRGREPRRAVTLAYVEDDVKDAWVAGKQRRLGRRAKGPSSAESAPAAAATPELHATFVSGLRQAAARLRDGTPAEREVAAAVEAACEKLARKAELFDPTATGHDDQRTEDHLRRLERHLLEQVRLAAGDALHEVEREVEGGLRDKSEAMSPATLERVRRQLVDRRLRAAHGIPRLSIFYT